MSPQAKEWSLAMKTEKRFAWAWYAAGVHAALRCATYVVVIALDAGIANRY